MVIDYTSKKTIQNVFLKVIKIAELLERPGHKERRYVSAYNTVKLSEDSVEKVVFVQRHTRTAQAVLSISY